MEGKCEMHKGTGSRLWRQNGHKLFIPIEILSKLNNGFDQLSASVWAGLPCHLILSVLKRVYFHFQ